MADVSAVNVWPELDGKRVAGIAVAAFLGDATSSSGGRVTVIAPSGTAVAWFLVSTESTASTRFAINDATSSSAATVAVLGTRAVTYGGSS